MPRQRFIVRATARQAARWEAIARYQGHRTVGAWLGTLATEKGRQLGRLAPRKFLSWKPARFRVRVESYGREPTEVREVAGLVAGPFAVCRDGRERFLLVHAPTHPAG